jgi:AraC-like DNA-binding protein
MNVTRRPLFESKALQIGLFETRPTSDACGDVEWQTSNVVVLPFRGVFAKHDAPGRYVIGTPSHAVLIAADTPYRLSFPGAIGDRALIFRFGEELALEPLRRRGASLAPHGLLPSNAILLRDLLRTRLQNGDTDRFETEASGLDLLNFSLNAMRGREVMLRHSALGRRIKTVAGVKEAVALAPAHKWSIAELGSTANLSPFHLCRVFRQIAGAPRSTITCCASAWRMRLMPFSTATTSQPSRLMPDLPATATSRRVSKASSIARRPHSDAWRRRSAPHNRARS